MRSEPLIIRHSGSRTDAMTFTGAIGRVVHVPAARDHRASVALGIHPNVLTLIGVLINVGRRRRARDAIVSARPA